MSRVEARVRRMFEAAPRVRRFAITALSSLAVMAWFATSALAGAPEGTGHQPGGGQERGKGTILQVLHNSSHESAAQAAFNH